jgi:hypothetical protein
MFLCTFDFQEVHDVIDYERLIVLPDLFAYEAGWPDIIHGPLHIIFADVKNLSTVQCKHNYSIMCNRLKRTIMFGTISRRQRY